MKVSELEIGMMLEPAGDSEIFLVIPAWGSAQKIPYTTVRCANLKTHSYKERITQRSAMYLGRRKDVHVDKRDMGWSDRYLLIGEMVTAVDPSAWRRMKEIK